MPADPSSPRPRGPTPAAAIVFVFCLLFAIGMSLRERDAERNTRNALPGDATASRMDEAPQETQAEPSPRSAEPPAAEPPRSEPPRSQPPPAKPPQKPKDSRPDSSVRKGDPPAERPVEDADKKLRIPDVTIRDQNGRVVYKGEINLKPTLNRIAGGGKNQHRNDGSTFENREGRLPKQRSGYYKEYVHPTPGVSGPGPQRVVLGEEGEVFYTSDHYRSFRRIR